MDRRYVQFFSNEHTAAVLFNAIISLRRTVSSRYSATHNAHIKLVYLSDHVTYVAVAVLVACSECISIS